MPKKSQAAPTDMPAPGAPQPSSAGLLVGVYAAATISGITVLHLFEWELRFRQTLVEVTAHSDEWEQWIALRQGWTGRARGYLTRSAQTIAPLTDPPYHYSLLDRSNSPNPVTFTGYSDFGTNIL